MALLGDTETVAAHLQAQVVELMGLQDEAREREAAVAMDLVEAQVRRTGHHLCPPTCGVLAASPKCLLVVSAAVL